MATTEKDQFIQNWEREFQTTLKVLKSYPTNKLDLKPSEKSRSAKDLAWTFVVEEAAIVSGIVSGQVDFTNMPQAPATMQEIIAKLEQTHNTMLEKVKRMSDSEFNSTMKFPVAPKTMGDFRRADVLWMVLMDSIHHRGQFSVYLRMAGAKVPSIYGPTADEPWM